MGGRVFLCSMIILGVSAGCEKAEPRQERIEIAAEARSCVEGEACGVVETSCESQGCECGVAVNEKFLLEYQQLLAECRGQNEIAVCDFQCPTPFAKCFNGACVLTDQPVELFKRGRSLRESCESTGGRYVGCPECPPNARCKSCTPCECPTSHRWTKKGCRRVVRTEPRDILVEVRPPKIRMAQPLKARVHNESKRTIWLKTLCGTPFYRARKKQDQWETAYQLVPKRKCKTSAVEVPAGKGRPFVVKTLSNLSAPSGELTEPGTYRFELTYTDGSESFRHYDTVYSAEFDAVSKRSRK
ncbi:MAG: hypothetical protein OEQ49_13400 [Myxococcales bacterium]|nr:hypothetical protein [Myxococcales bacterium]